MNSYRLIILVPIILFFASSRSFGAKPAPLSEDPKFYEITTALSGGPSAQPQVLALLGGLYSTQSGMAVRYINEAWVPSLIAQKQYDFADEITIDAIVHVATNARLVESLQTTRVRISLDAGRPQEALKRAKGLFNVASLDGTKSALLLMEECLQAAFPGDTQKIDQFRAEQWEGARNSSASDLPSMIKGFASESDVFRDAIDAAIPRTDSNSRAKANLLLLADRAKEARIIFERLAQKAKRKRDPWSAENDVARSIKAEDGLIGRANAYLIAIDQGSNMP
jgi:hypothetical protein